MKAGYLEELRIKELFIITEDRYGKSFLENIIAKLGKTHVKVYSSKGRGRILSPRLRRLLENVFEVENFKDVVILIDGDGNAEKVEGKLRDFIPSKYQDKIFYIVFDYEIEEWITRSLDVKVPESVKPSDALNEYLQYKRRRI